ncbi:MAG: M16 family metallopeptidase [Sphingomonadales bacterium]
MTVKVTTLPSGLRVTSAHMPHLETTAVGMWVDVGARCEKRRGNGVSHLLEHMAFKGTSRRSARQIAEEIEAVGGQLNAYTSREQTAYYARVLKDDMPLAIDILGDILQHSTFADQELEREREVVIQEIGETNDTPDDVVFEHLQSSAYPGQALGRSILGTVDLVRGFSRDTLRHYMNEQYRAPAMVLSAAGNIDHDRLVALAEKSFAGFDGPPADNREAACYAGGDGRERRDLEQVHLTLGFNGLAFEDPDFYALQVFSTVLGGGMSSRLFQEVRETRGLAYSVYSFSTSFIDGGLFGVYAGTGPGQVGELVPVIADVMGEIAAAAEDKEVGRARAQLKAGLLMSLESSSARCEQIARQLLIFGRIIPVEELIEQVDAVDAQAVRKVARRILAAGKPTVAAVGPIERLEPYDRIAARFN